MGKNIIYFFIFLLSVSFVMASPNLYNRARVELKNETDFVAGKYYGIGVFAGQTEDYARVTITKGTTYYLAYSGKNPITASQLIFYNSTLKLNYTYEEAINLAQFGQFRNYELTRNITSTSKIQPGQEFAFTAQASGILFIPNAMPSTTDFNYIDLLVQNQTTVTNITDAYTNGVVAQVFYYRSGASWLTCYNDDFLANSQVLDSNTMYRTLTYKSGTYLIFNNFTVPNATLEAGVDNLSVIFDATDTNIDQFKVNDTRFAIDTNLGVDYAWGTLTNATVLSIGVYELNISVNDTSNNVNSTYYKVTVNDTTAPTVTSVSTTATNGTIYSTTVTATDLSTIDSYRINDTTYFSITDAGVLSATGYLPTGIYRLLITANDTSQNSGSGVFILTLTLSTVGEDLNRDIIPYLNDSMQTIISFIPLFVIGMIALLIIGLINMFKGGNVTFDGNMLTMLITFIIGAAIAAVVFFLVMKAFSGM